MLEYILSSRFFYLSVIFLQYKNHLEVSPNLPESCDWSQINIESASCSVCVTLSLDIIVSVMKFTCRLVHHDGLHTCSKFQYSANKMETTWCQEWRNTYIKSRGGLAMALLTDSRDRGWHAGWDSNPGPLQCRHRTPALPTQLQHVNHLLHIAQEPLCCQSSSDTWKQRHKTSGVLRCLEMGHWQWILWVLWVRGWGLYASHLFLRVPQMLVRLGSGEFGKRINALGSLSHLLGHS